jgi:hypothetical protein
VPNGIRLIAGLTATVRVDPPFQVRRTRLADDKATARVAPDVHAVKMNKNRPKDENCETV